MPDGEHMSDDLDLDLDLRRRRCLYRARHRGTKEMDWLLGRYADVRLAQMDGRALAQFEKFIDLPDDKLQYWIMQPDETVEGDNAELIKLVRMFHGLT